MNTLNYLSVKDRPKVINKIQSEVFDLIVVGGGITGAGIALDAAARGMKVVLFEKKDFASGTSSRSTKLIHGGLRYLKNLELGLVKEVGRERAIVHNIAPHLVIPEKMLLPLIEGGTLGKFTTSLALKVYDVLAGVSGDDRRKMLSKEETLQKEPLLRKDILLAGGLYAEYRTDDARLTIELIKTASQKGAISLNYTTCRDILYDDNKQVCGVRIKDEITGQKHDIKAQYVVNAAGPWVDHLRKMDHSMNEKRMFLSKGVHIVLPFQKLPLKQSLYFDVPDGRMIFAIPRQTITYIGTTDTPYKGDIENIQADVEDVDYLLKAINNMFPEISLTINDVQSTWAGVRPLIFEEGKSASEISRKDEIFLSKTGMITIAGGKLTGYRKMAQRTVDLVSQRFQNNQGRKFNKCNTTEIILSGGPFQDAADVENYKNQLHPTLKKNGLDLSVAAYLVHNYGKEAVNILTEMTQFEEADKRIALARSELKYCLENELVYNLQDFIIRRSGRLYFNRPDIPKISKTLLADIAIFNQWSEEDVALEKEAIEKEYESVLAFQKIEA